VSVINQITEQLVLTAAGLSGLPLSLKSKPWLATAKFIIKYKGVAHLQHMRFADISLELLRRSVRCVPVPLEWRANEQT
jgi:hypothetical protein